MKSWRSLLAVTIGIGIGCGIGYFSAFMIAADKNVLLAVPTGSKFQRVFTDMGQLYAFETLYSNCKGTSDIPFPSLMAKEANVIQNLRESASGSGLTPAVDVAESMLAVRNEMVAEAAKDSKLQAERAEQAQKLLQGSGWTEPTAARMRQVIAAVDNEECRGTPTTGKLTP